MIKSSGIDEKIWLDFRTRSTILYQYPFKFSLFFASPILVLCRCLHRFSQYSSISFFPICVCFYRGFISGPFLLLPPLLLPEFVSVGSILSSDGFVSRFLPARYRFSFLTRFRRVKAFCSIRRMWQCPNLMIKNILHLFYQAIYTSNEYYYNDLLRTLLLSL
jgi:hypothetical protein